MISARAITNEHGNYQGSLNIDIGDPEPPRMDPWSPITEMLNKRFTLSQLRDNPQNIKSLNPFSDMAMVAMRKGLKDTDTVELARAGQNRCHEIHTDSYIIRKFHSLIYIKKK